MSAPADGTAEGPASLAGAVDEHDGQVSTAGAGTDAAGGFTMLGEAGTACEGDACLI